MISLRAKNIKASPTLALAAKAKELAASGNDVISLSVGEPDWDTLSSIKQAAKAAIDEGFTKYLPANGMPALRQAIVAQTNSDFSTSYSAEQVTVTAGGKFVIFSAFQALLDPQDEVIIAAPYWVSYPTMVEMSEAVPVVVETKKNNSFKLTADELKAAITGKTKLFVLNSPSNPTGNMYSSNELKALADVLRRHPQVMILSDDIYNRLVFGSTQLAPHFLQVAPDLIERVVNVNGFSKTYSMTGWRLGWAVGPSAVIKAMNNYQSQTVSCANSIAQKAGIAAFESKAQSEFAMSLKELESRCKKVFGWLKDLPGVEVEMPDGAFYFWLDISKHLGKSYAGRLIGGSSDFSACLLEDQMVVVVPGAEFGTEGFLRISYALKSERMKEAIDRMAQFLKKLV